MITLTSARRRAEELDAAVDGAAPTHPEVAALVGVVDALRTHAAATSGTLLPRPEFSAQLRERLMAEAAETWSYDPSAARLELPTRTSSPRRERRLVVAATALVLAGGSAGMAAAAQQALPGEALYPIKRGLEEVRTDLTGDDVTRGRTLLTQADNRLGELGALAGTDTPESALSSTLTTYGEQAGAGSDLLIATGDEAAISEVRGFTQQGLAQLQELAPLLPAELTPELRDASRLLEDIDARATEACPGCVATRATTLPAAYEPALDDAARVLASLEGGPELANDHPLISDRIAPPVTMRATERSGSTAGSSPTPEAPGDVTEQPVPDDGGLLDLPKLSGDTDASAPDRDLPQQLQDGGRQFGETARKGTDALKDTVEGTKDKVTESLGLDDPRLP